MADSRGSTLRNNRTENTQPAAAATCSAQSPALIQNRVGMSQKRAQPYCCAANWSFSVTGMMPSAPASPTICTPMEANAAR